MQTLILLLIFTGGLVVLYFGAETMLKGAVNLARAVGISPLMIGLTLVAFGTSTPELSLNLTAAFKGTTDLAFGDLVGSNIATVGFIIGVGACIRPLSVKMHLLRVEVPIAIAAAVVLWGLAADGELGRIDGLILLIGLAGFLVGCYMSVGDEPAPVRKDFQEAADAPSPLVPVPAEQAPPPTPPGRPWQIVGFLVAGLAGLIVGAQLMVHAAIQLALQFGMSEVVIGLTIVAIGTTLPELATAIVGALRNEADIVIGNVIGSNIFNILAIAALVALVRPITVHPASIRVDIPIMITFTAALVPIMLRGLTVTVGEGAVLLTAYAGFLIWQLFGGSHGPVN